MSDPHLEDRRQSDGKFGPGTTSETDIDLDVADSPTVTDKGNNRFIVTHADGTVDEVRPNRVDEHWMVQRSDSDGGSVSVLANSITFYDADGRVHRDDGPAVVNSFETSWVEHGVEVRTVRTHVASEADETKQVFTPPNPPTSGPARTVREETEYDAAIHEQDYVDGTTERFEFRHGDQVATSVHTKNGEPHRAVGPAVVATDGLAWYRNGKRHRDYNNGPAVINGDGTVEFYEDGQVVHPGSETLADHGITASTEWTHRTTGSTERTVYTMMDSPYDTGEPDRDLSDDERFARFFRWL